MAPRGLVATLAVLGAVATSGCTSRTEVARGPVVVGRSGVTLPAEIAVTGPASSLCIALPADAVQEAAGAVTRGPAGRPVQLSARLAPERGDPVQLDGLSIVAGPGVTLCYEGQEGRLRKAQRFRAVTLSAADTLTVGPVTWQSGTRYKLLP